MKKEEILEHLKDFDKVQANKFANYCIRLLNEKKKSGSPKNPWMKNKKPENLAELFKRVDAEGMVFDGESVTLQSTGVSYDYQAYKKKMYLAYPETILDVQLVYDGDEFEVHKESGSVEYTHKVKDPFNQKDDDIIGAYCVIKNKRGEFLTTLSKEQIQKRRSVAKTDYIWKQWFPEMCLKTVIKRACSLHFKDDFKAIEEMDNENYDLSKAGLSEVQALQHEIGQKLDVYQGDDKEEIRAMCAEKKKAGEFTKGFANNVLEMLK